MAIRPAAVRALGGHGERLADRHLRLRPLGEVVRRGEHVHAADSGIGKVHGLVIDRRNDDVTHVLRQEGHRCGRENVANSIRAVTGGEDGIRLNITKQQVQDLPARGHRSPGRADGADRDGPMCCWRPWRGGSSAPLGSAS